ncbi:MAG: hypothetical protein WCN98_15750 [Verrucomicrobiaceae bacterium]
MLEATGGSPVMAILQELRTATALYNTGADAAAPYRVPCFMRNQSANLRTFDKRHKTALRRQRARGWLRGCRIP